MRCVGCVSTVVPGQGFAATMGTLCYGFSDLGLLGFRVRLQGFNGYLLGSLSPNAASIFERFPA